MVSFDPGSRQQVAMSCIPIIQGGNLMRKLIAVVVAAMFALSTGSVLAASHAGAKMDDKKMEKKDEKKDAKKDEKKDAKKDGMKKDEMKKDEKKDMKK
jgi:mannitol-specific phosphotransferase system IIBC component